MVSMKHKPVLLAAIVFAISAICAHAQQPASADAKPAAPQAVIASQGGISLTFADMDTFAQHIPADKRAGFFNSPTRIDAVIGNLLVQKQLAAEARKAGMDRDPQAAADAEPANDEVLGKAWLQRFRAEVKVPDLGELAREHYMAHKEIYVSAGTLTVKDVSISTESRSEAEAQAIAATVEKKATANPDQFDALVEEYSDAPNKATTHGLLEQVDAPGKYVEAFAAAAKALGKAGDISPVISTPGALHVIKLVERLPSQQLGFDAVKADIIKQQTNEYIDRQVQNHVDELRNQPMTADPEAVASLRTRYGVLPNIPGIKQAPPAGK